MLSRASAAVTGVCVDDMVALIAVPPSSKQATYPACFQSHEPSSHTSFSDRLTGIVQFAYVCLVGTFPFNSFLSGFIATVGFFILLGKSDAFFFYGLEADLWQPPMCACCGFVPP